MGTYFDKKKLLDENSELYISPYDKNLDIGSLSQIIEAKKDYKAAEESGNKTAMLNANNKANAVRNIAGKYDGGNDGSEYNRKYADYEIIRPAGYKSKYNTKISDALDKIYDIGDFEYDAENDPLFRSYKKIYLKLGNDAYDRALYENALRTGGMVSSSAQSAAMQAKNGYNSMLAEKIPELYKLAYNGHRDKISDIYDQLKLLAELDKTEYSRYRDDVSDFESDRKYFYEADKDFRDNITDIYKTDSETEYKLIRDSLENEAKKAEAAYKKERDAIADSHWEAEQKRLSEKDNSNEFISQLRTAITLAKALTGRYPVGESAVDALLRKIIGE